MDNLIDEFSDLQLDQFNKEPVVSTPPIRRSARVKQSTKDDNYAYFNITNSRATNFKRRKKRKLNTMNNDQEMADDTHKTMQPTFGGRGRGSSGFHATNNAPGGFQNRPPGVNTVDNPYNNSRLD